MLQISREFYHFTSWCRCQSICYTVARFNIALPSSGSLYEPSVICSHLFLLQPAGHAEAMLIHRQKTWKEAQERGKECLPKQLMPSQVSSDTSTHHQQEVPRKSSDKSIKFCLINSHHHSTIRAGARPYFTKRRNNRKLPPNSSSTTIHASPAPPSS